MDFSLVVDSRCDVGESCVWDDSRECIWFCDIYAGRIHKWTPSNGRHIHYELAAPIGSFGLCSDGHLVVAHSRTLMLFNPETLVSNALAELRDIPEFARLNDGKVGPDGAYWVGTVDDRPRKEPIGTLYRITPDGGIERKVEGICCSNGLAWSDDGRTLYHSDSRGTWVDAWDFDSNTGRLSNRRRLATPSADEGRPDGAACDAHGNYWSAGVSAGCLNVYAPDGMLVGKHTVPVPAPTMVCFAPGGLFVTSLRRGLPADSLTASPKSGGLFWAPSEVRGARSYLFSASP